MTKLIDFSGPFLKTERADHHIANLEDIFWQHVRANKKRLRPKRHGHSGKKTGIVISFPRHTPTILGDALHNLRASLDHAYCVLVEANGHTVTEHTKFPFTVKGRRQDLKGSIEGQDKAGQGPGGAVIDHIIDVIQPYPGGNGTDLVGLHMLDITDKHMVIIPTATAMHIDDMVARKEGGGSVRISGISLDPNGIPDFTFDDLFGEITEVEKYDNPETAFEICFQKGQPFEGTSIIETLRALAKRVNETLLGLHEVGSKTP